MRARLHELASTKQLKHMRHNLRSVRQRRLPQGCSMRCASRRQPALSRCSGSRLLERATLKADNHRKASAEAAMVWAVFGSEKCQMPEDWDIRHRDAQGTDS